MAKKTLFFSSLLAILLVILYLIINFRSGSIETPRATTLTRLPDLPELPLKYRFFGNPSSEEKNRIYHEITAIKIGTYPENSSLNYRPAKHRTTGLFSAFEPTENEIKKIAPHYDLFLMIAKRGKWIPTIKKLNPKAKILMYFDSTLRPWPDTLTGPGSVNEKTTAWVWANHPEWLLKNGAGEPLKSGGGNEFTYFGDPGNKEFQEYYANQLNEAFGKSGGEWDGILLDDFYVQKTSYDSFWSAGIPEQYQTDEEFRAAQLEFIKTVVSKANTAIIVNTEPAIIETDPDFYKKVKEIAKGIETEVFVMHSADKYGYTHKEQIKAYLELLKENPKGKIHLLNTPTGLPNYEGLKGNTDLTLYAYYTYLLVAAPEREIYWTFKEGDSDIPHFWFKEFDLNIGAPLEEFSESNELWKRDFQNARVLVNPTPDRHEYIFSENFYNVLGQKLESPLSLDAHSGILLVRNLDILK